MQDNIELTVSKTTRVLVVSDIHLRLPVTRELSVIQSSLVDRIAELAKQKEAVLVLNGDVFELWEQTNQSVADIVDGFNELTIAIQKFAKGREHKVIYIVGNHDELLASSPTDRAVVEHQWRAEVAMGLIFNVGHKTYLVQHGHQYDPYNKPNDSKESKGKKLVQNTLPMLVQHLPSLFDNIGDVSDRSLLSEYVIGNFIYKIFAPVVAPLTLLVGIVGSIVYKNWEILIWTILTLVAIVVAANLVGMLVRLFSNFIFGGGETFLKKVDRSQSKNKANVVVLGHTHQGGITKRHNYIYANSGCNDIVATKHIGWLGALKFTRSVQLSGLTMDFTKNQPTEYHQENLPLVE